MVTVAPKRNEYAAILRDLLSDNDPGIKTYAQTIISEDPSEAYHALMRVGARYPEGIRMVTRIFLDSEDRQCWNCAYFAGIVLRDESIIEEAKQKRQSNS